MNISHLAIWRTSSEMNLFITPNQPDKWTWMKSTLDVIQLIKLGDEMQVEHQNPD